MLAEADGNRTRQTEMLGLTGFEDRGAHQDTYASAAECITARGHVSSVGYRSAFLHWSHE